MDGRGGNEWVTKYVYYFSDPCVIRPSWSVLLLSLDPVGAAHFVGFGGMFFVAFFFIIALGAYEGFVESVAPTVFQVVGGAIVVAAIVAVDVAGYSRLMGADEQGTLATLKAHRKAATPLVQSHGGRLVGTAGDGLLLCSDGLHGPVDHKALEATLTACEETDEAVRTMIALARNAGAPDNITAVVEHVTKIRPAAVKGHYIKKISLSATRSPGVLIDMDA